MRKRIIVICAVVLALLIAMGYYLSLMMDESRNAAVSQMRMANTTEQESGTASSKTAATVAVPDLVSLLGMSLDDAVDKLGYSTSEVTMPLSMTDGGPAKTVKAVILVRERAEAKVGTPTVYLGLDDDDKVVHVGFSAGTSSLGYASLSFSDLIMNEHIVQATLKKAGLDIPDNAVVLPEDKASYSEYDSDGTTRKTEMVDFEGTAEKGDTQYAWSAAVYYDYTQANASGNLVNTLRQIFISVRAA